MRRKIAGVVLVILGAVLIGSALLLYLYNSRESNEAGEASEELLVGVQAAIEERVASGEFDDDYLRPGDIMAENGGELTVVYVDGYDYIGYLTIPDLELALPVMSDWSYEMLRIAPCRQFGSPASDDLVVAAHNYDQHFGRLSSLEVGAIVTFTDMNGLTYEYELAEIRQVEATDVDAVQNSEHDLVLYTCTYGGQSRVTAFCDRVENPEE